MMDGRLKTLHPKVHGGLLALRDNEEHMKAAKAHGIEMIDMVVINLYRFEDTVAKEGCTLEEAIENIDIGGPTMVRSAAKNYRFVSIVTDPEDYPKILEEMKKTGARSRSRQTSPSRQRPSSSRPDTTPPYPTGWERSLPEDGKKDFPDVYTLQFLKAQDLRYGENPHQKAVFYREGAQLMPGIAGGRQLQGKELSYNNIMDSDAAWQMACDFELPTAVIMKHANPCGAATSKGDLLEAYKKALETDPLSAFGGIVAVNRPVDKTAAEEIAKLFLEVVIAPKFEPEALKAFESKKNLRLIEIGESCIAGKKGFDFRRVVGGLLVQERDADDMDIRTAKVVTKRKPTEEEYQALDFAWRVVKHVKSNAIVLATKDKLVGVGAGQMSRVDSVKIAIMKATSPTKGTVMGSDAFFPFRDVVDTAAKAGVTAIIQPGGSIRDEESIQAADEHGIAMIFTGVRHFKH